MRKAHWMVGVLIVVLFLVSGQYMRHHEPPMTTLSDSIRLMFRSRHIYLLASGLVNLILGLYLQRQPRGWRGRVQTVGSCLLLASPAFLILAFLLEPERGLQPELPWSHAGLYALFGGCMMHFASKAGKPRPEDARRETTAPPRLESGGL